MSTGPLLPPAVLKRLTKKMTPIHPPLLPKIYRKQSSDRLKPTDSLGPQGSQRHPRVVSMLDSVPVLNLKAKHLMVVQLGKGRLKRLIPAPDTDKSHRSISILGVRQRAQSIVL